MMNRTSRILTVVATTILTFGTLMATVGQKHFNRHFEDADRWEHCDSHKDDRHSEKFSERHKSKTDSITNKKQTAYE
jgi:Ni/Co efflux regulator RcnB